MKERLFSMNHHAFHPSSFLIHPCFFVCDGEDDEHCKRYEQQHVYEAAFVKEDGDEPDEEKKD